MQKHPLSINDQINLDSLTETSVSDTSEITNSSHSRHAGE